MSNYRANDEVSNERLTKELVDMLSIPVSVGCFCIMLYFEDALKAQFGLSDGVYSFVKYGVLFVALLPLSRWIERMLRRI